MSDLDLTATQVRYLLYIVETEKSLKECAVEFGITEDSLNHLLTRVDKKYPGFRKRLMQMRRKTKFNGNSPKIFYFGTLYTLVAAVEPDDADCDGSSGHTFPEFHRNDHGKKAFLE